MAEIWRTASLPEGVLTLVQGARETGEALAGAEIDGLLFTGSVATGMHLRRAFAERPEVILALELGGNNPLVVWDGDPTEAASIAIQSGYVTTGQRCSCARRLIVPQGAFGEAVVETIARLADALRIGCWNDDPEPYIGPLVSVRAADTARAQVDRLIALGARCLRPLAKVDGRGDAFVTPALLDVTGIAVPDEEIFAPVMQVVRVPNFDAAITEANLTRFGLAAGLVTGEDALWGRFVLEARAGVVNRNRPTTGAAGSLPFGGLGESGNHRPSASYAADYCAYPVASFEAPERRWKLGRDQGAIAAMTRLTRSEAALIEPVELAPKIDQTLVWVNINSGTHNRFGLETMAQRLADAFSALPAIVELVAAEAVSATGNLISVDAGRIWSSASAARPSAGAAHRPHGYRLSRGRYLPGVRVDRRPARARAGRARHERRHRLDAGRAAGVRDVASVDWYDVLINSDEETGSGASAALISTLSKGKFAALTYEPSLPGAVMARARPGSGNFSALVKGRSAHAGRNPQDGRNAVVAGADLVLRLSRARRPGMSVNPAKIDGGGPNNVVPALAVVRFNMRPRGIDDATDAVELVARLAAQVGAEHDVSIDIQGGIVRAAKPIDAATERLFALVTGAAASDLGDTLTWQDSGGVCDGNNIVSCGVPVIDTMGPCGEFIHSPQEYLDTASLGPKARLSALVLHRLDRGTDRL